MAHLEIPGLFPVPLWSYQNSENKGNFVPKPLEAATVTEEQSKEWRLWQSWMIRARILPLTLSHSFCDHPFLDR